MTPDLMVPQVSGYATPENADDMATPRSNLTDPVANPCSDTPHELPLPAPTPPLPLDETKYQGPRRTWEPGPPTPAKNAPSTGGEPPKNMMTLMLFVMPLLFLMFNLTKVSYVKSLTPTTDFIPKPNQRYNTQFSPRKRGEATSLH